MYRSISRLFGAVALTLGGALGAIGTAHAGLVTGAWDPEFGPDRPGLFWQIQGTFLVPNTCSNQGDGVYYVTPAGPCAGASTVSLYLRLFNGSADPSNFFESDANSESVDLQAASVGANGGYILSQIRIIDGQVVGFTGGFSGNNSSPIFQGYTDPSEGDASAYGASFGALNPSVVCYQCGSDSQDIFSDLDGLTQFLITYTSDDTSAPKFTDGNGNALGAVLDSQGNYLGQSTSIPEPGALALAVTALLLGGIARRRH